LLTFVLLTVEGSRRLVANLTVWDCPIPTQTPADVGIATYETTQIQLQPDQVLTAWYIPSQNGASVLLLQGHWAGRDGMLAEAQVLTRHGYGVMLLDPHPCAGPDVAHTMGYAEVSDVAAAVKFMRQRPDVIDSKIGVFGFSIGGVIAIESAARIPDIQAVIAEGNFDNLITNITPRVARGSVIGGLVQALVRFFYRRYTGVEPDQVKPIDSVAEISPRPILFIAGEGEIEANRTLAQYEAAGQPKEMWVVPEVAHGGYLQRWPEEYEDHVLNFFDRYLLNP